MLDQSTAYHRPAAEAIHARRRMKNPAIGGDSPGAMAAKALA